MKKGRCCRTAFFLCLLCLLLAGSAAGQPGNLGRLEFPNSGAPAAQKSFIRAVLLLHSFEYADAAETFREAQKMDPDFALAYWGEAMTCNHPLWKEQDVPAARAVLNRFAPTPAARQAKTPTERERGYVQAVEILFGEGDKVARDLAYAEAMRELHQAYPDDLEAASFYALAVLGTGQGVRDYRLYMKAASIVEEVFDRNPQHPGAIHYLIHSYDDPIHAPLGLRAARVYAKIAPAATHAQHMISHIYMALGRWEESNAANEKSFAVSEERARRKGLPIYTRSHHALHWLAYGYLQKGRFADARRLLDIMEQDAAAHDSPGNLWYFAEMRANYIVETGSAEGVPGSKNTTKTDLSAAAADSFASGLAAVRSGDIAAARSALAQLQARQTAERDRRSAEQKDTYTVSTPRSFTVTEVLEKELQALIQSAAGNREEALRLAEAATRLEDSLSFDFGPPEIVKPSHELYGELLLEAGRHADARSQFAAALDTAPRRARSLLGLARAAARSGDHEAAEKAYTELRQIWSNADSDLPELSEVRREAAATGTASDN